MLPRDHPFYINYFEYFNEIDRFWYGVINLIEF